MVNGHSKGGAGQLRWRPHEKKLPASTGRSGAHGRCTRRRAVARGGLAFTAAIPAGGQAWMHGPVRPDRRGVRRTERRGAAGRAGQGSVCGGGGAGGRARRVQFRGRSAAGGVGRADPFRRARPADRRQPEPSRGEAERHRTAFRRPSSVRRGEHPQSAPARRGGGTRAQAAAVIGKIIEPRGEQVRGLIYYLYGPGRANEHTYPHLVAGWRHPAELEPPLRLDGSRDFRRLNGLLAQPHAALGPWGFRRPVWHCVASAAPGDRVLSDDEWAHAACEIMHRTGLSTYGREDEGVRWVAIRHAANHIHIVAMLARQDGRRPRLTYERYRTRAACRAVEERFGLTRTAPGDRTAARRPTRAENEKARRCGFRETPRVTLRRQVATAAAGASSEREFFASLRRAGVQVRLRRSTRNPGEVTGYAVGLPADATAAGGPVWYGGGKLAADLTLPKLRRRWHGASPAPGGPFTAAARAAIWDHAAAVAADAARQIRHLTATDPTAAADAAWAAGDTLHVAAQALGSRVIRQAADAYDRAACAPYARIPRRAPSGDSLRRAARLLSAAALVSGDPALTAAALIARLAALIDAVADLRAAQQRAAQAAAARQAAERLRAGVSTWTPASPPGRVGTPAQTAASLARAAFPGPPRPLRAEPIGPRSRPAAWPVGRPVRGPGPPAPRRPRR